MVALSARTSCNNTQDNMTNSKDETQQLLLKLIEEEVDLFLAEQEYSEPGFSGTGYDSSFDVTAGTGVGSYFRSPSTFGGALLTPLRGVYASVAGGAAKMATIGLSFIGTAIGGTIAGMLPFAKPELVTAVARKMQGWEEKNVARIERYFGKDLAAVKDGWNKIRGDFWGIGFIASPFNAIAAISAAGRGLDAAATVGNVISGGRLQRFLHQMSGGSSTSIHADYDYGINEATQPDKESLPAMIERLKKEKGEAATNKLLQQAIQLTLKDPGAKAAEQAWVSKMLPAAMVGVMQDVNNEVAGLAKAGQLSQQELEAYKAKKAQAGDIVLGAMANRQGNKFKIEPPQAAKAIINNMAAKLPV